MKKFNQLFNSVMTEMVNQQILNESVDLTPEQVCKDQGTINRCQWDPEFAQRFDKAEQLHEQMVKEHPEDHDQKLKHSIIGNCYHKYYCKCGYSYKVDSSG